MKFLFISTRKTKPSYRFRIEQHVPFIRGRGHKCTTMFMSGTYWSRIKEFQKLDFYDVIVLQKKLLTQNELNFLKKKTAKLIYDIDDAVMFNSKGEYQARRQRRFKNTIRLADEVICGNEYLAEQSKLYNRFTKIIPTAVNCKTMNEAVANNQEECADDNKSGSGNSNRKFTIGWTGSKSNASHLNALFPILSELGSQFHLKIISDSKEHFQFDRLSPVSYEFIKWTPQNEFSELSTINAGLMPLPDTPWTRGKCSFKALQYMALGIPAICSPVGMNEDLIQHGQNGFLAQSKEDWKAILLQLQKSVNDCDRIGKEGQRTVRENYDIDVVSSQFINLLEQTALRYTRAA